VPLFRRLLLVPLCLFLLRLKSARVFRPLLPLFKVGPVFLHVRPESRSRLTGIHFPFREILPFDAAVNRITIGGELLIQPLGQFRLVSGDVLRLRRIGAQIVNFRLPFSTLGHIQLVIVVDQGPGSRIAERDGLFSLPDFPFKQGL